MTDAYDPRERLEFLRSVQEGAPRMRPMTFGEWSKEVELRKARGPIYPGVGMMGHLNTSSNAPTGPRGRPSGEQMVGWPGNQRSNPFLSPRYDNTQQFGVPGGGTPGMMPDKYLAQRPNQPPPWIDDVSMESIWYSPFQPVWPFGPPYYNVPREWNFPVGYNLNFIPERIGLYAMLREMRRSWGPLAAIEATRMDQLLRLPWTIQRRDKPRASSVGVDYLRRFFKRPDGKLSFGQWSRKLLFDLFDIDAPYIYLSRGTYDGKIQQAEVLDGATIFPLIDDAGRRPDTIVDVDEDGLTYVHRQPAFQQIIYGLPMINLSEDELIYAMMRPQPDLPMFGYSPVQQIFTEAMEGIRKTFYQLEFWRSGSMPELIVTVPDGWCYSEDTEVLTRRGWAKFTDVDISIDEFATRNPRTKEFEWQKADGINISDFDGNMVSLKSRTIDCLVNPPHRVLISRIMWDGSEQEEIKTAEQLLFSHSDRERIPVTSKWTGEGIPGMLLTQPTNKGGARDLFINGDAFCAFMGAWLAEGHVDNREYPREVCITQAVTSKGYLEYKSLFEAILEEEISYDRKGTFHIYNSALARYLTQFGHAENKFVPEVIMNAVPSQIEIFLRFYMLGDGSMDNRKIYTSSEVMANQLQELIQKVGLSATIGKDDRRGRTIIKSDGRTAVVNYINYRVNISDSSVRKFGVEEEFYKGKIGCVSVPNGILYVRRNGKPCWSGNTPRHIATFQAHFDALLSGQLTLKSKVRFVPGGMKPFDVKNASGESLWSQRDELLVRLACYAFSVSPTPFVRQMNRGTAQTAQQTAQEEGLYPLMSWFKDDIMDRIIQDMMGFEDVEFIYLPRPEVDLEKQSKIHQVHIDEGVRSRNEVREELGQEPIKGGDIITVKTGTGVIPLDMVVSGEAAQLVPGAKSDGEHPRSPPAQTASSPSAQGSPMRGPPRAVTDSPQPTAVHKSLHGEIHDEALRAKKNPTPSQKEAGNYRKGHIKLHGLDITLETARGRERHGHTMDDKKWSSTMAGDYGYIRGTLGADGDQIDICIGRHPKSSRVFVVDQFDTNTKQFDEHKVMLGYRKAKAALRDYLDSNGDGLGALRAGHMTELSIPEFKRWLVNGNHRQPIAAQHFGTLVKADTISTSTNLSWYSQTIPVRRRRKRAKKRARRNAGPRWLELNA